MTMSNSAVAEAFATGATEGASKNMYIEGDVIYSYGSHFPIAERIWAPKKKNVTNVLPDGYVFNSDNYSMTTARHKSEVWCRIRKDILWELPGCSTHNALQVYARRVLDAMKRIPRCRSGFNFSRYLERLEFNFGKAIEASKILNQDIQPLYNVMDEEVVAAAIKRIKKEEGTIPDVMLTVFGKAKFLAQNTRTKAIN